MAINTSAAATGTTCIGVTGGNPVFGTAVVAGGGTGVTSTTAYAVLTGGTTSTGAIQSIAGVGSAGQVLTSNGAGALPTFQGATSGIFVKQVRATSTTATNSSTVIPYDDTIPQNTEGAEVITVSITPANTNNILVIQWNGLVGSNSNQQCSAALFQDSTANALNATSSIVQSVSFTDGMILTHTMTAGTTSSTTFKIRIGPNSAGTITLNGTNSARLFGGVATSVITVTEYTS